MSSRWRLAGELAVVSVLAAATTVGLTVTRGEAPQDAGAPSVAVGSAPVPGPPAAAPESFPLPALPVARPAAAASSGRSVGRSAWRTALDEPAARSIKDIPVRALEAYQRAAIVIDLADDSCHLDWPLLAALAKVESDHGRYAGATINSDGRVRPLILGPRLTGSDHTRRMPDTDAGRLDGDRRVDRALGPFQIVPATWAQVQVDADLDGRRDPNDVDDAALAAAVFLCSGPGDLATSDGQRLAVRRYNQDGGFARLVMDVMTGYEQTAAEVVVLARVTGGPVPFAVDTDTPTRAHRQRCLLHAGGLAVVEREHPDQRTNGSESEPVDDGAVDIDAVGDRDRDPDGVGDPVRHPVQYPVRHSVASPTAPDSPSDDPELTVVPTDGSDGMGVSLSTGLPLTVPGCVPLLWMLRRRRHPAAEEV